MNKGKSNMPLYCTNCKVEFTVEYFGGEPYDTPLEEIVDYCSIERLKEELQLLNKIEQMYKDYPESRKKMVPKSCRGENADLSNVIQ